MTYHYTAYFYHDEDINGFRVTVPPLDIDYDFPDTKPKEAEKAIREEIEALLSVYEYDEAEVPPNEGEADIGYDYSKVIECSTGGAVREIRRVY